MNRGGFALLAALWLIVAITAVMAATLAGTRTGLTASQNRIALTRGGWAAEACGAILEARYSAHSNVRVIDTADLGEGLWCTGRLEEPADRVNLNVASSEQLRSLLESDSLSDALLDWRDPDTLARADGAEQRWYLQHDRLPPRDGPLAAPAELRLIRGFDSITVAKLLPFITTYGDGRIDLSTAPVEVIVTLPGLGAEAWSVLDHGRASGTPLDGLESLASALSPGGRALLLASQRELQQATTFAPALFEGTFAGGVRGLRIVGHRSALLVPVGTRLAILRRIVE
jgi:type II secretory pathway component PulK